MEIKFFSFIVLGAVAGLFAGCTESSSSTATEFIKVAEAPALDPALQAFLDEYDRYFSDSMALTGAPGAAVVIVKDNRVIFTKGYGEKVKGSRDSVDIKTAFRIGSLSKGFAGVLTGILVQKGFLNWDDAVQKHYPEFSLKDKQQAQRIKIWHLLSHTTGLPYHAFGNLIEQDFDLETVVRQYFPTAKLSGREGEFFGYQNTAFCVIEPVLQAATGKSYPELLSEYIFQPSGMRTASCDFETMRDSYNKALPHSKTEAGWVEDSISPRYYGFAAAGGVNASLSDMGEWLLLLLGHKPEVVDDSTLSKVFRPVIQTGKERRVLPAWIDRDSASYALGWRILKQGGDTLVYHSGFVNNFHSEIAMNRRLGIGICVLFNGNTPMLGACIQTFFERWKVSFPKAPIEKLPES